MKARALWTTYSFVSLHSFVLFLTPFVFEAAALLEEACNRFGGGLCLTACPPALSYSTRRFFSSGTRLPSFPNFVCFECSGRHLEFCWVTERARIFTKTRRLHPPALILQGHVPGHGDVHKMNQQRMLTLFGKPFEFVPGGTHDGTC